MKKQKEEENLKLTKQENVIDSANQNNKHNINSNDNEINNLDDENAPLKLRQEKSI